MFYGLHRIPNSVFTWAVLCSTLLLLLSVIVGLQLAINYSVPEVCASRVCFRKPLQWSVQFWFWKQIPGSRTFQLHFMSLQEAVGRREGSWIPIYHVRSVKDLLSCVSDSCYFQSLENSKLQDITFLVRGSIEAILTCHCSQNCDAFHNKMYLFIPLCGPSNSAVVQWESTLRQII